MSKASFKEYALSGDITKALDHLGYKHPTAVQSEVIPAALKKRDVVVKSRTGSGKTAAFGIPLCELTEWEENKPQALILTPTRELAAQVKEDLTNIGRYKRIKAAAVYGKSSFERQKTELKQKCHIVVGTPGRVLDHIEKGTFPLEKLKYLVIDEADEMLNMGFIDQVGAIIRHLPEERLTMLFSATFPEDVEQLSLQYMKDPLKIEMKAGGTTTADIEHQLIIVDENDPFSLLVDLFIVENPDSCIVFCRTQEQVNELQRRLAGLGYPCAKIHGGMAQEDRFAVMKRFRRGAFRYLIATDVAARGIDIENITHVINYELPLDQESYVHRTGRTGRAGSRGKAITLASPREKGMIADIEDYIGFPIPIIEAPSKEEIARAKAAFLKKINAKPDLKKDKSESLNKEIMRLYFNGGKKKKLRAVDFVGTIAKIDGVSAEDIGIITIQEQGSFVEILNGKGPLVLDAMKNTTVKGKLLKVHKARK
ncbi:DEAD/DEAH box helicase [Bacillus licheniformis]|uniref:DEAD/DEAH box helicase n=1 Tax=Bacillus licheniformis TaxID=1402 RepID=UPI000BA661F5|nr:DEAD/DEAH box helicase [Bacillus licheniformis]MBK4206530.1 DEAD/DEAH box helicase [Bacillus licheniformis]PAE66027.1 RNA helicase [Bacillus licheniformis]PDH72643.1 RNA helicase [Bacillus licheniformis]TWM47653.1 ATP-dependent RNA helicase DbpA [Bacillus licheniformis]